MIFSSERMEVDFEAGTPTVHRLSTPFRSPNGEVGSLHWVIAASGHDCWSAMVPLRCVWPWLLFSHGPSSLPLAMAVAQPWSVTTASVHGFCSAMVSNRCPRPWLLFSHGPLPLPPHGCCSAVYVLDGLPHGGSHSNHCFRNLGSKYPPYSTCAQSCHHQTCWLKQSLENVFTTVD